MRTHIRYQEVTPASPLRSRVAPPAIPEVSDSAESTRSMWLLRGGAIIFMAGIALASDSGFLETLQIPDRFAQGHPKPGSPPSVQPTPTPPALPSPPSVPIPPPDLSSTPEELYQQTYRSVVVVRTSDAQGSGALIRHSDTTVIVTNEHVVGDAAVVQIKTVQGLTYEGIVRGKDASTDLAIVEISTPLHLPAIPLQTQVPAIGSTVYALGNPIGLEHTFTQGIVSRLDPETGEIQHSAAIAPGSSGSPLINDEGEAVGVNRAVFSKFEDLSIAIPAQAVAEFTQDLAPE
jgi:S1-C subfamily serine protease